MRRPGRGCQAVRIVAESKNLARLPPLYGVPRYGHSMKFRGKAVLTGPTLRAVVRHVIMLLNCRCLETGRSLRSRYATRRVLRPFVRCYDDAMYVRAPRHKRRLADSHDAAKYGEKQGNPRAAVMKVLQTFSLTVLKLSQCAHTHLISGRLLTINPNVRLASRQTRKRCKHVLGTVRTATFGT